MNCKIYKILAILSTTILLFAVSCQSFTNDTYFNELVKMDSLSYKYSRYVFFHIDSLKNDSASNYDKSYQKLIKIVALHRLGRTLSSDSDINKAVEIFSKTPHKYPQNYIRALIYQGIIRYQLGVSDNKAYEPIKQALLLSEEEDESQSLNLRDQQIAYYYLGLIQYKNNNINQSHEYFKQALFIAENLNDSVILFKTYRDLFWNRIKALDFFTAKSILYSLQNYPVYSDEQKRDISNAESAYYNSEKKYRNALNIDYDLMKKDKINGDKKALLADYFRISDNYKYMNKLDSALHYGELATKSIVDTSYYLNYYYYLNVANIAEKMGDYKRSSNAYAQVYTLMNKAITQELNTQILELEKKYDLSEEQNRSVRFQSRSMWFQFITSILILLIIIIFLIFRNINRRRKENERYILQENKILEQENKITEQNQQQLVLDKKNAERQLVEKQFIIPIYRQISQRNADIKNFLLDLKSHSHIAKNPPLQERIEEIYKNYIQTTKITETELLDDKLFANLTGISEQDSRLFNDSDKMMLSFISIGTDNQQMATLFNTSVESIRVRKSKLKKKMEESYVKIPEYFNND